MKRLALSLLLALPLAAQYTPPSGGAAVAVTIIARLVVGSPAATVTFSSLGTAHHLQIVISGQCSGAVAGDFVYLQANGDAAANYEYQWAGAVGLAFNGDGFEDVSEADIGLLNCQSAVTNAPGTINFTLPEYGGSTFTKQGTGTTGNFNTNSLAGSLFVGTFYWSWNSTTPMTAITMGLNGGTNFVTGTTFTLYGLD